MLNSVGVGYSIGDCNNSTIVEGDNMCSDCLIFPSVTISYKHAHLPTPTLLFWNKNTFVFQLAQYKVRVLIDGNNFNVMIF